MRDVLEEQLAARLRDLGDVVPAELEPPADLDARVARAKKAARGRRYGTVLAIAAGFLVVVAIGTVLDGRTGDEAPVAVAPTHDPLPAGTVMLGAKGRFVTARDANGKVLATMVKTTHGNVLDAQVTADHKTIFYRVTDPASPCDKIARADIDGRSSEFVARGSSFAISPDGSRLAIAGRGDLAEGKCAGSGEVRVAVLDLEKGTATTPGASGFVDLVWNDDRILLGRSCQVVAMCELVALTDSEDASRKVVGYGASVAERGADGLYQVLRGASFSPNSTVVVTRGDVASDPTYVGEIPGGWAVADIIPTPSDLFVIASPSLEATPRLYRLIDGRPELVSDVDPGAASPVFPIP